MQESEKKCSLILKDHSQEQTTKLCKSASGNLFDMPEIMNELNEKLEAFVVFEDAVGIGATAQHLGHHEERHSLQMRSAEEVLSVTNVLTTKWSIFGHAPYSRGHAICNRGVTLQCIRKRQRSPRSLR